MRFVYFPMIAVLWWSCWHALKRARDGRTPFTPILGWLIGLGYFILVPLTLLVLNGGFTIPAFYDSNSSYASVDLSSSKYFLPMVVVWLSLLFSFQAVIALSPGRLNNEPTVELSINNGMLKRVLLLTFGVNSVGYIATVWASGGLEAFLVSHWYRRQEEMFGDLGDLYVLYLWLTLANSVVFTAAASMYTAQGLKSQKLEWRFFAFVIFALLLQMVMSGNRIFIALYGLAFLTSCWIYRRRKPIVAVLVLSPVIVLVFSAWSYFRHDLNTISEDIPTYLEGDLGNRPMTALMDATEGVNVMLLLHIVNDFGTQWDYLYGASYSKALTFVVPRRLYPEKPAGFTVQLAKRYEPGEETSLGATQLGELYANFGVLSVLLLPAFTAFILLLSEKLARRFEKYALRSAVLFILLIWCARSTLADNFAALLVALVLIRALKLEKGLFVPATVYDTPCALKKTFALPIMPSNPSA
jgi:oligosaccharide repeat unit polymerase